MIENVILKDVIKTAYEVGYLDGRKRKAFKSMKDEQIWKEIRDDCIKAFDKRFNTVKKMKKGYVRKG